MANGAKTCVLPLSMYTLQQYTPLFDWICDGVSSTGYFYHPLCAC